MSDTGPRSAATCRGVVDVPLPAAEALPLFTPEGERAWVEGWAPTYPAGGTPAPAEGVSFQTEKDGATATWLVTRYDEVAGRAAYAYVLPGGRATLVDVRVEPAGQDRSRVHVTYHVTSLSPAGDAFVRQFESGFQNLMEAWTAALEAPVRVS